jgi:hypothetical protein
LRRGKTARAENGKNGATDRMCGKRGHEGTRGEEGREEDKEKIGKCKGGRRGRRGEREREIDRWIDRWIYKYGDAKEIRYLAVLSSFNCGPASRFAYSTICSAVLPPLKSLTVFPASLNTLRVGKDVAPYLLQMGLWAVQSTLPSLTLMPSFSCETAHVLGMHDAS